MKFLTGLLLVLNVIVFSCNQPPVRQRAINYCPFDKSHMSCQFAVSRSPIVYEAEKFACEHFEYMDDTMMWVHSYYNYQQTPGDRSCIFWLDNGKGMVTVFDKLHPKGASAPADWLPFIPEETGPPTKNDSMYWPRKTVFNCRQVSVMFVRSAGYQWCWGGCPETPEYGMRTKDLETLRNIDAFCQSLK